MSIIVRMKVNIITYIFFFLTLISCGGGNGSENTANGLPQGFPDLSVPENNKITHEKVVLGRKLFYDKGLSKNQTFSCGTCHQQDKAFTDGRTLAIGSTGENHPRNSLTIINSAYQTTLNWANPLIRTLENQLLIPLFSEHPVELGFAGNEDELLSRLNSKAEYIDLFSKAFPGEDQPITLENLAKAIATFERKIISGNSDYDRFVYQGDTSAMSDSAKRGMNLFFSERLECDHCHGGFNFSSPSNHDGVTEVRTQFENNGLYNISGNGSYPKNNTGLFEFTLKPEDMGRFRPPSLRNVELTAPYMHDGSIATLEEVIAHYQRGGRNITTGPYKGDGSKSPYKSGLISGFSLSNQERDDLIVFLRSLTDWELVSNPELSDNSK